MLMSILSQVALLPDKGTIALGSGIGAGLIVIGAAKGISHLAGQAMEGIAQHIKRNWEKRMRVELMAHVDEHQGEGLDAIVKEAIDGHRALLAPQEKV